MTSYCPAFSRTMDQCLPCRSTLSCVAPFLLVVKDYSSLFLSTAYASLLVWFGQWPSDAPDLRPLVFLYPEIFLWLPGIRTLVRRTEDALRTFLALRALEGVDQTLMGGLLSAENLRFLFQCLWLMYKCYALTKLISKLMDKLVAIYE